MAAEPGNPTLPDPNGFDQTDLVGHQAEYYIWADHFGGSPLGSRAVASIVVGLFVAGACTHTVRTVILDPPPPPNRDVRGPEVNRGPSTAATLGVPPGHLPKPGECRIWIPGTPPGRQPKPKRSEEHTSELQSLTNLVCRLLLEKKKTETCASR